MLCCDSWIYLCPILLSHCSIAWACLLLANGRYRNNLSTRLRNPWPICLTFLGVTPTLFRLSRKEQVRNICSICKICKICELTCELRSQGAHWHQLLSWRWALRGQDSAEAQQRESTFSKTTNSTLAGPCGGSIRWSAVAAVNAMPNWTWKTSTLHIAIPLTVCVEQIKRLLSTAMCWQSTINTAEAGNSQPAGNSESGRGHNCWFSKTQTLETWSRKPTLVRNYARYV